MKYLKIPFLLVWRLWFYVLLFTTIILMSPLLFLFTIKEAQYHLLWKLMRTLSKILIYGMGFRLKIQLDEKIESHKSYMFCPNHASLIDPFIVMILSKNPIVFIGKQELGKIPIFGFFYKRVVILVDRSSPKSRKRVFEMAKKRLQNGVSMAIFPEGLVPAEDVVLAPFKKGAFSLAIEFVIPIVPQVYYDSKRLFSWNLLKGGFGVFRIRQHKFIHTKGLSIAEKENLKDKTYAVIYTALAKDKKYMKDTNRKK